MLLSLALVSSLCGLLATAQSNSTPSDPAGSYKVINATIKNYPNSRDDWGMPASQMIMQFFTLTVSGTNPGALPVFCNATWNPESTNNASILATMSTPFDCVDQTVHATLQSTQRIGAQWGWFIIVQLENANPAAWMVKNLNATQGWGFHFEADGPIDPGMEIWQYTQATTINTMPNETVADWNRNVDPSNCAPV